MIHIQPSRRQNLCNCLLALLVISTPLTISAQTNDPATRSATSLSQSRQQQIDETRREQARRSQLASTARHLETRGGHDTALKLYQELHSLEPNRTDYFSGVVRNLVALNRFEDAIALLEQEIASPGSIRQISLLYAELGAVHHQAGNTKAAELAWEQAVESDPHSTLTYQNLAGVFIPLRLLDRAEAILQRGRSTLGDSTLYSFNLASLLMARMDWEGAVEEYLLAMRTLPGRGNHVQRTLAGFSEEPEALQAVQKVVKRELARLGQQDEPWPGYRAQLLELLVGQQTRLGQYDDALEIITQLDGLDAPPGQRLLTFAAEATDEGFTGVAQKALALAAEKFEDPEGQAVTRMTLAELARQQGDGDRADSLLGVVLANPVSSRVERGARLLRGVLRLEDLNDPLAAAGDFRELLRLPDPSLEQRVRYLLALSLARVDSLDQALAQLGRVTDSMPQGAMPPPMPGEGSWLLEEADAGFLEARIAFWLGRPATAAERILNIFKPPTGADAENEALDYLQALTTTQDSSHLELFAHADRAAFQGRDSLALVLLDSLSGLGRGYLHALADWQAARIRFDAGVNTALLQYAERDPEAPHAEEALFFTAQHHEFVGETALAVHHYETLLFTFPEGLLTAEARLRYDALNVKEPSE